MAYSAAISASELEGLPDDEIVDAILGRLGELRRAGCDTPDCFVVAARLDVSLDAAVDLVARGCPAGLVLPILL